VENLEVRQPGCFGDILFIQKLCKIFSKEYNVYHYVFPQMWNIGIDQLETNITCGPNIYIPNDGLIYDCSAQYEGRPPSEQLTCKYDGADISWNDWDNYLKYRRLPEREMHLKEKLGILDGEPFILANKIYSNQKIHYGVELKLPEDYDGRIIWMDSSLSEKIFDWCWIFENAEQIHTVDTCINYIVETLNIKANTLVCHPRHWNAKSALQNFFSAPWQWIDCDKKSWKKLVPGEDDYPEDTE
jgi:hypothetical protein